jgi:hypothetical protein
MHDLPAQHLASTLGWPEVILNDRSLFYLPVSLFDTGFNTLF